MAKLLYISQGYSTHDRRFLKRLSGTHEVWFLPCQTNPVSLESRPLPGGVHPLEALLSWKGKITPWVVWRAVGRLRKYLKQIQPDLVHAGPVQTGGFFAALAGAKPLVLMSWGSDVLVVPRRSRLFLWITQWTLRQAQLVVADCEAVKEQILSLGGLRPEQIIQLPFGIELDRFKENSSASGIRRRLRWEDCQVVISTRSFEPGYGSEVFLQAMRSVLGEREDVRVVMLGDGSMQGQVRDFVKKHQLAERIYLPGQVPEPQVVEYFRDSDLYVSATQSDGTSVSLLEAMACGLPVVVPDAYGNREWVRSGVNGWRYPVGDAQALSDSVLQALRQSESRSQMAAANQALVKQRANFNENFNGLLEGYQALLDPSSNGEGRHA